MVAQHSGSPGLALRLARVRKHCEGVIAACAGGRYKESSVCCCLKGDNSAGDDDDDDDDDVSREYLFGCAKLNDAFERCRCTQSRSSGDSVFSIVARVHDP